MVIKLVEKDGCQNPFADNRPGKDWWYAFLCQHSELAMCTPEHQVLQLAQFAACSEEVLLRWYAALKQLMTLLEYGMGMKLGAFSVPIWQQKSR